MVEVEIGDSLEAESAGESEQDEVAAAAQELLAGRRCLHARQHYRPRSGAGRCQRSCVDFAVSRAEETKWVVASERTASEEHARSLRPVNGINRADTGSQECAVVTTVDYGLKD